MYSFDDYELYTVNYGDGKEFLVRAPNMKYAICLAKWKLGRKKYNFIEKSCLL